MKTLRALEELRRETLSIGDAVVGLVPTMGYFHDGHLSLMRKARAECDLVVVSLFVNPIQFGPSEDLDRYPRDEARDRSLAEKERVDIIYAPTVQDMYRPDFSTFVEVGNMSDLWCGASRPGHFRGVTTVVAKLFNRVRPHRAYFGEKDYQQLVIIRRMAADLDFPVTIVPCPIVRESDGLAASSRNVYLTKAERIEARRLSQALFAIRNAYRQGSRDGKALRRMAEKTLNHPSVSIEYLGFVDPDTLKEKSVAEGPVRVLVAAGIGKTRLIDNIFLGEER